jgi:hypothetical protein
MKSKRCAIARSRRSRKFYAAKDFEGPPLQMVVGAITADRGLWFDFMMRCELGLGA